MWSICFITGLAAILYLGNAAAAPVYDIATKPLDDDFYKAPDGFEHASPGNILRSREPPADLAAFGIIPIDLKSAHQIQYRTTNSMGEPSHSITTVLVPHNANTSRLVSYQDFEDSAYLNFAPSYALQQGSKYTTILSQANFLYEAGLLNQGYILSIPDYEGPDSAFGSGPQAGMATLDAIRAVLQSSSITGIAENDVDVVMWGYSGGSIPTEWAAELHPTYAPELKISGAAIGGTIANLTATINTINGTGSAGFGPAGILGLYQGYKTPELTEVFQRETFESNRSELFQAGKQCAAVNTQQYNSQDIGKYFRSGLRFLSLPQVAELIEKAGIMGKNSVPTIPLYFYKSTNDEIDPVSSNDELIEKYCSKNVGSLEYYRNDASSHVSEAFFGADGAVSFLNDRFDGVPPVQGCHIEDVTNYKINVNGLRGFGNVVVESLVDLISDSWMEKVWHGLKDYIGWPWW